MIIFLYGEDSMRSRGKLEELKTKFKSEVDPNGSSLTVLDGENTTIGKVNDAVASPSLFVRKRMVVIENIFKNKNKDLLSDLVEYFEKISQKKETDESNIVIFWDEINPDNRLKLFGFLKKQKFVQHFKPLSNTEATEWVKQKIEQRGSKIRHQAALHLTGIFGVDLWQLNNEINKLISYKAGQQKSLLQDREEVMIEVPDVEMLARGNVDENIFALTDAISQKNKGLALELLEKEIEAGIVDAVLIHMVIRQFKILLQVRQAIETGMSSRKIINQLKLHPFVVQKSLTQVRKFTLDVLKKSINELVDIDMNIKTGQVDARPALSSLIARI